MTDIINDFIAKFIGFTDHLSDIGIYTTRNVCIFFAFVFLLMLIPIRFVKKLAYTVGVVGATLIVVDELLRLANVFK